jgi:hypothetical protein
MNNNDEMNSATVLVITPESESKEMMSEENDIESQNVIVQDSLKVASERNTELKQPLKGILKKPEINNGSDDHIGLMAVKCCTVTMFLICMLPIIFCDIYYGLTDKSCVNDEPDGLNITLKLYLLVSGFSGLALMIILICTTCSISPDDSSNMFILLFAGCIGVITSIFSLIWNILGAVIFWGNIYKEGNCDSAVSTYIYVTLIIKFVGNFIGLNQQKKNKNNKK